MLTVDKTQARQKTNKIFRLSNGLKVILHPSRKSPVISVQMWVKTGSADEAPGEEGISHFIEHLVFKGSAKYGVGEIASVVEGSGGELNAYTSFDQTVFYVTISKEFSLVALDVVAQMMGHPSFDSTEIDREREVVIEEIKRSSDSLSREASRLMFETMFLQHPYGVPVIGYDSNIRKMRPEKIRNYYKLRYVPNNMALVIVGDFQLSEMEAHVRKFYNDFETRKLKLIKRVPEPLKRESKVKIKKGNFEESVLNLTWPAVNVQHRDVAALDVMSMVLGQGQSSRLNQSLCIRSSAANYVQCYAYTPLDPGLLSISVGFNPDRLDSVLEIVGEEIAAMREELVSEEEFMRAINNLESEQYFSMETVDGLSSKLGSYNFYFNDPNYHDTFIKQIRKLRPEDLQAVAIKYFNLSVTQATMITKKNSERAQETLKSWLDRLTWLNPAPLRSRSNFKVDQGGNVRNEGVGRRGAKSRSPENIKLSDRASLLLRHSDDVPLISLRGAFLGGARGEDSHQAGLTELLSATWLSGTSKRSEEELLAFAEGRAIRVRAFGGRNTSGMSTEFLTSRTEDALELFREVLLEPRFPDQAIFRERDLALEQIRAKADSPSSICIENLQGLVFAGHPYGRPYEGTFDTVSTLKPEDVRAHYTKSLGAPKLAFAVAGEFDPEKMVRFFGSLVSSFSETKSVARATPLEPLSKPNHKFTTAKKEQSHLAVAFRGLSLTDSRRYALQILNAVLAGQGGRLFLNLRDRASLAYTVSPLHMEGIEGGYFGGYIGCSPEKVETALSMLRQEFSKIAEVPLTEAELQRAKRYLIGKHDIALQRNASIGSAMLFDEIYGIPFDETFKYAERISSVTAEEVRSIAQFIFSGPSVTSLVGPRDLK